jgi:hypothetical protein
MIDHNKILSVPVEEKAFIDPRVRPKFFMDLIQNYKDRYPNFKLIYAYLNTDAKIPIDYVIIFSTKNVDNTMDLVIYDAPLLYNDRSLPGYRYCKRLKIEDDFFKEATNNMVSLSLVRFNEYINMMLNLSIESNNELYWKRPEYAKTFCKGLLDLSLRFNKRR